jgi:DNA-binding beta-propeller fold protein YncE
MAIQVSGTEVISNARELSNIASVDATTVTSLNDAGVGGGFKPVSVSGATQALNVGTYNFFNGGDLSADTTLSFTSVPTDALWTYTAKAGLDEAYTVEAAAYTSLNAYVGAQGIINPVGVTFSSDGTKMYVLNTNGGDDTVYQYTLGIAWNVSTATYASLNVSVGAQDSIPYGVDFSSDGTKMYIIGRTTDTVYQYTLGTAWNVSTATYASLSKSVASQESDATDVTFSSDGTKMYVIGTRYGAAVYQYTLGTAWNVSTATYASLSVSVGTQEGSPQDLAFSSDGTKMLVIGTSEDTVFQYTLGTAWNVSTATYASISFRVATEETVPNGLAFSSDGTKMYVVGSGSNTVYQYQSGIAKTITVPAAVQNTPATKFYPYDQVSYTFVTNDGGTTVRLIGEEIT